MVNWKKFCDSKGHWIVGMNGCHHDAGHQGQQQTLCLLNDQFWWPSMATQIERVISSGKGCIQHEGIHVRAPVWLIIVTTPLELLHVDFTWWTFFKACHGIHDPQSNCKNYHYVSMSRLHLNLWSTGQAPEWLRGHLWKQHHQRALWAYGDTEG